MTMPEERTRALRWAGEFLRECRQRELPEDLARQIDYILRHYPGPEEIRARAQAGRGTLGPWLLPERPAD
jgi:hypothetical protein